MFMFRKSVEMPSEADALPGRDNPLGISGTHFVNGEKMTPPYPEGFEQAMFGLGCFGGPSAAFGSLTACSLLRWVTRVDLLSIRPTKKYAQV